MRKRNLLNVRLVSEGTRVILLAGGAAPHSRGVVAHVRPQTHLKSYEVLCDDGALVFVSAHDIAREDDAMVRPLGGMREG